MRSCGRWIRTRRAAAVVILCGRAWADAPILPAGVSERLAHRQADLVVDLGVGLWAYPLPMDFDGDGDHDLVVATPNKPSNGVFFFENKEGDVKFPVFERSVRVSDAVFDLTVSFPRGEAVVLSPETRYPRFSETGTAEGRPLGTEGPQLDGKLRGRQWMMTDYDGDGRDDLVVGIGVWTEYGWDDAYNEKGEWTNGPLRGFVYVCLNEGDDASPRYAAPEQVMTEDGPVDVYGAPSPNFADFDGDGDLDLVCGEFLDRLTYFENIGSRTGPRYAKGRCLQHQGEDIRMDLEMLQVIAMDWDKDGDVDLIVGQEDGRVALVEHAGGVADGMPVFLSPRFFEQRADLLKVGALNTPSACDWDGDGDEDFIVGDTAGYISFVENLDGGDPPAWAKPVYLEADGKRIRIQAGPNGSIQGPAEAKWGYTVPCVADWNGDGLLDIVMNSIWGEVLWYENIGSEPAPRLAAAKPLEVEWDGPAPRPEWNWWDPKGKQLVTQWRTSPVVLDLDRDGLNDLVMLDHEGFLAFFQRQQRGAALLLLPGKRIFKDDAGNLLHLNPHRAGKSGRRKLTFADWDGDGKLDILINGDSIDLMLNVSSSPDEFNFRMMGSLDARKVGGHTTCPTTVDWDRDGIPDLVYGAEDGYFYYLKNLRSAR